MDNIDGVYAGLFILRVAVGIVMLAHGYNHIWGGGKIEGTARWFESLGMKPGIVHAWTASLTELGAGTMLILGFLQPLAAAGVIGVMLVALITNHLKNGFFIFRPGEGYEYVLTLLLTGFALAGIGAGKWSIDWHIDSTWLAGWKGILIAAVAGVGGAVALLVTAWRPPAKSDG
ncbi:MAG: DoxX family protein [Acidimicrobiia bacterium]